jgi:signal transduction histidine kinase
MDSLQNLKTTIEAMLAITRSEADRPIGMGGNMWGVGYAQGIRAGYHSQATCLTMLLEHVELETERQAEPAPKAGTGDSQIVPRALAEIQSQIELENLAKKSISPVQALEGLAVLRSFFGPAKTRQQA